MIRVEFGMTNSVVMRLWDYVDLNSPNFLFKMINNKGEEILWRSDDNSNCKSMYNQFTFSVSNNTDPLDGGFTCSVGTYFLDIYESLYNDLNIASASYLKSDIITIWDNNNIYEAPVASGAPIFITK
jgi:hypothetical protein